MDGIFLIPFPTGKNSGKDIRALERTTGWRRVTSVAPDTNRKLQAVAPGLGGTNKCEQSEYDIQSLSATQSCLSFMGFFMGFYWLET